MTGTPTWLTTTPEPGPKPPPDPLTECHHCRECGEPYRAVYARGPLLYYHPPRCGHGVPIRELMEGGRGMVATRRTHGHGRSQELR